MIALQIVLGYLGSILIDIAILAIMGHFFLKFMFNDNWAGFFKKLRKVKQGLTKPNKDPIIYTYQLGADMNIEKVKELVGKAAVYVPIDCEGIRISYWDTDTNVDEGEVAEHFYGVGEESGEEYCINFSEVDLENDMFYALTLINQRLTKPNKDPIIYTY